MANIKSSKKSVRKVVKLTKRNKAVKTCIKTFSKKLQEAKTSSDSSCIKTLAKKLMSLLDKAKKKAVLHRNKVNRLKSKISSYIEEDSENVKGNVANISDNGEVEATNKLGASQRKRKTDKNQ